ncbi:hypothetical protein E2562_028510 [Oryza meyeriana var. granulata]|uniref:Uncharacterized protein n=1 Tax=Oryza meyeriana var. granulata TaxID=110450 RepID=A0A6G1DPR3_9ORYZ|nr:hypothetical protein E2562_028510 [Oryza meyeriana var. granulata]
MRAAEADQSRVMYELCALLLTVLRSTTEDGGGGRAWPRQVTAAGVASMLLGASVALMLCGSVTFMLGFFLMPWVIGLACVFLFVGFVTNLSGIWRAILWPAGGADACSSSPKSTRFGWLMASLLTSTKQSWKKRRSVAGTVTKVSLTFLATAARTTDSTPGHVDR